MLRTRLVAGVTSGFVLSAIFATVLTIARFGDAFVEALRVRPGAPAPVTLRMPRTTIWAYSPEADRMTHDTVAVTVLRGSVVTEEPVATLVRHYEAERRPPRTTQIAAQWLAYFLLTLTAATYMRRAGSDRAGLLRAQVSLFSLSLATLVACKALVLFTDLPPYVMPIATVPLWAGMIVGRRTGLMLGLMVALCAGSLVGYDPVVIAVYVVSTIAATYAFRSRKRSSLVVVAGALGGLLAAVVYVAAREIHAGFDLQYELEQQLYSGPASTLLGGVAGGLLAFIFHAPVSRLLGIVSRSELLYLSDLEQPLLQRMAERAPGSWEHSRMMANLAEAAAAAIGADSLLTRVGAYYHDLGKSVQSKYFVENLRPGEQSPHEQLAPEVSADAIMAHVVEGVRILREGGIPEAVVEFAYTHHGTSVIEFFWHKCKKEGNPGGLNENAFRYPGMRPRTKETGILMLVDAIEAGARTVDPPNRKKFGELVRRVIFTKLQQGQLDESGLTPAELRTITNRIIDTLCSAYHSRIRYPWQEQQDAERKAEAERKAAKGPEEAEPAAAQPTPAPEDPSSKPATTTEPVSADLVNTTASARSNARALGEVPQESQAFPLPREGAHGEPTTSGAQATVSAAVTSRTAVNPPELQALAPQANPTDLGSAPENSPRTAESAAAAGGPQPETTGTREVESTATVEAEDSDRDPAATGRFEARARKRKLTGTERASSPGQDQQPPARHSQG